MMLDDQLAGDHAFDPQGSSLEFTEKGSILWKGFKIGDKGVMAAPDGAPPSSGITTADINFQEEIGRGASSTVFRALVPSSPITAGKPSQVAVKVMHTVHDSNLRKQLFAELQQLRPKLQETSCPYILRMFEVLYEKDDDRLYIVLEYCDAGSLDCMIRRCGPTPEHVLSVIMRQILFGLIFLFNKGIQHRDIKPANILIDREGIIKISDFGSSKEDEKSLTFCGTTRYMAPERLNGDEYGWPADLWAAGITMLETALGHHPYKHFGHDSSFIAILDYAKRECPRLSEGFSEDAQDFAELCITKDPHHRPSPAQLIPGGEESLHDSHPFIENFMRHGPQVILQHLAQPRGVVAAGVY
eukprot:Tamp_08982.p1 GENE.Tamp_08982~~Tamp_08982.p1  ORF type:complete len:392 (-),score=73.73 Tamp_08982:1070-2140(-)